MKIGRCTMLHYLITILTVAIIFILVLQGNHPSFLSTSDAPFISLPSISQLVSSKLNGHDGGEDATTAVDITDGDALQMQRHQHKIQKWQGWQGSRLSTQQQQHHRVHNYQRRFQFNDIDKKLWRRYLAGEIISHEELFEWDEGRQLQLQQLRDRRQLYEGIHSELMYQSAIYATIQRSLREKRHIQWQMNQVRIRRQLRRGFEDRYESSSPVFLHPTRPFESQQLSHNHHQHNHYQRTQNRRQLEDSFDNAFGTGRPGSTYGYNMFCGTSWADASTSCESRQNCPSGQSDECIMPGHECWAFTECDTRFGHGEQFSEMHDVTGAENLMATGEGAVASGGFVDLSKPSYNKTDHYFCGVSYDDAISRCKSHCASGSLNDCPTGEICFLDTPCDARMLTKEPSPPSPTYTPTTPAPVMYSSKLNKYFCGSDWNDAQQRCEVWCPSGSDDDCPDGQLCFAFSQCHAVDMNATTLKQQEEAQSTASQNGGTTQGNAVGVPAPSTMGPTNKPSLSAEQAMHRYSFCGKYWDDARDNCETNEHCEDDNDCPEHEFCWTETPCDFYATATPTTEPSMEIVTSKPKQNPVGSPTGDTASGSGAGAGNKQPTRKPALGRTLVPTTYFPSYSPTITAKPTDKPVLDSDDPAFTFFCGTSWDNADSTCGMRCPSGNSADCPNELECWAFTSCKEEKGIETPEPIPTSVPTITVQYVPGIGGAQVPVFGGVDYSLLQPSVSPLPSVSNQPVGEPAVLASDLIGSYFCGKDWNDVEQNCHQPCPSGNNVECENPEHSCWAFVLACKVDTSIPVDEESSLSPADGPVTSSPNLPVTLESSEAPVPSGEPSILVGLPEAVDNEGEAWESNEGEQIDNEGENFDDEYAESQAVDNEGEAWGSNNQVDNENDDWNQPVDNEGESWDSNSEVNNEGEDWNSSKPSAKPIPASPTGKPTADPTIDLMEHLENMKSSYFCSETWENIDCENAQSCPSGDSKDCPEKQECFSGAPCKSSEPIADHKPAGEKPISSDASGNESSATTAPETAVDETESNFFCGSSWETIVESCETAKPCPSGTNAECEGGQTCFANTPCGIADTNPPGESGSQGIFDFTTMVEGIPAFCDNGETMSRNVGYWQSWSIYRNETCNPFTAASIDASSYTHIVFSFASISADGTLEPWDFESDIKGGQYQQFIDVKKKFPETKAIISVGGWTHNEPGNERLHRFSNSAASPMSRMKFSQSSVAFMRKYGFDGLDMDWEYPGDETRGGNSTVDKENLVLLCQELRKYFDDAPEKFELSMAIPANTSRFDIGYDFINLAPVVHSFNVMAYDVHGLWDEPKIIGAHSDISLINEAIDYMLTNSSVPASQILLGLAAYGRSYTLADDTCLSLGCPFHKNSNKTAIGGCLDTAGFVPFVEIYNWEQEGQGKGYDSITVDVASYSAVMVKDDNQLISFDNDETFKAKVDYATSKCLGGTMVWAIDMLPVTQIVGGDGSGDGGGSAGNDSAAQSILSEEESSSAFCGKDWDDAITTCSRPCPSGLSDDCEQGETCFAGTPCSEGAVVAAGSTCKICPDSSSQGILSWVEIEVEIDGTSTKTTCGDLDYGLFLSVEKDSIVCDSVRLDHAQACCYTYPEIPCNLCRKNTEHYNIRTDVNVTMPDGTIATCGHVNEMLAPKEDTDDKCVTTQDTLFDACCYKQCTLCQEQGLKWWVEFDESVNGRRAQDTEDGNGTTTEQTEANGEQVESEMMTCSSIDASLYSDFIEAEMDSCTDIKSQYSSDCCYTFPTNACGLCKQGNTTQNLLWPVEVDVEGKNVTCGVLDNMLNAEEDGSSTCSSTREAHFESCCFDKCSLCGNAQLAWDFVIDENSESAKTCGEIDAVFAADAIISSSDECASTKAKYQDTCCFTLPASPCELCPEFVNWDDAVDFEGEDTTCKYAADMLKREDESSDTCSGAKEAFGTTCCYELCNICGESLMMDYDAIVEYDGGDVACGDLKPIFGRNDIKEGDETCSIIKDEFKDFCCYTPPTVPCNLCETETDFLDAYSNVEVDFGGSITNCSDVYDFLIRRTESDSDVCLAAKDSTTSECCYKKCAICGGNQLQDFVQDVVLDGDTISCLQLHTVRTSDIAAGSSQCTSMQSQFADRCCFDPPETPCTLCTDGSIRKEPTVDFNGETVSCDIVANALARKSNGTDECTSTKAEFQEFCCMDTCSLCNDNQLIDWDSYVNFNGTEDMSCGSFDWYFTSNAIEEGTGQCTEVQREFSDTCCYEPINYTTPACALCKNGEEWLDINGDAVVYFEGSNKTCTQVSNSLYRKAEDSSGFCVAARAEYFTSCCFSKCDICQGAQLDANVEVAYKGNASTCLELSLLFAAEVIVSGSEECNSAQEVLFEPCCFQTPTDPCRLCSDPEGNGDVRKDVSVSFYGSNTTCTELNSFLVGREEQQEFMCQAAKSELKQKCCYQECSVCGKDGNLYWDNPTTYNNITFACGELSWIMAGKSLEEGSDECSQLQTNYYDDCCNGPSPLIPDAGNKCEICPSGKDWYAQVKYDGKSMTCLELDTVLLKQRVFDSSDQCQKAKLDYSSPCCYYPPERPCNLCQSERKSFSILEKAVSYNGIVSNCYEVYNYLWTRIEMDDDVCLMTQSELFDDCCYDKCSICQDYQLDEDMTVTFNGAIMGCSEIDTHFIGLNEITQGSEQCVRIQEDHFDSCCYDIPCDLCSSDGDEYDLLVNDPVVYMGVNRTCGDWSVLAEGGLSQSDACKSTKADLFGTCCFKECNLCEGQDYSISWNQQLTYDGLASTCLDVYMNLRNERVQDGAERCQSVQSAVVHDCCIKMPTHQCSLCQHSNGTYLNTNWNMEVDYQGKTVTCGDVNARLSSEEIDSLICLAARDDYWYQCCTPQQGGYGGLVEIGGSLPTLEPQVSVGESDSYQSGWESSTTGLDDNYGGYFRMNRARKCHSFPGLAMMLIGCAFASVAAYF